MSFLSGLFLPNTPNPTIQVTDNFVYRNRDGKELIHPKEKHDQEGRTKKWDMYELSDYSWKNYAESKQDIERLASWLHQQGFESGDKMLIYAKTRFEWFEMALACAAIGVVISTAYDSMSPEAVAHIINEIEPKAIFTEITLMGTLSKAKSKANKENYEPKIVIYTGKEFEGKDQFHTFKSGLKQEVLITHWDEVIESSDFQALPKGPKTDDLAMIMYTSGTTGDPKGIEITHGNLVAAMAGAEVLALDILKDGPHCYIGYLPLAHVLEFILEFIMVSVGIPIGYATARTLMPDSVCGKDGEGKGQGDLKALKPTIMAGVPAVWEKIRNGVFHELDKQHWTVRKAFDAAVETKWRLLQLFGKENAVTRSMDATVFAPIRAQLGGRLRYAISGGAPISFDTHKFIATSICFLLQGYGLTECCGLGAITLPKNGMVTGVIGPPSPSAEFRLVDVPETDYKAENGQGELWIRGPSLMRGYYKRPDLTKDAITDDGWFKTGDVARLNEDGMFAITDRAKNLVKLSHGEYIALEGLESMYRDNKDIKNICIIANSDKSYIVAVVEPASSDVDKDQLLKKLQETARQNACNRAEIVRDIHVSRNVNWMDHFMTTSGKLKRKAIQDEFKDEINNIYK
ncbi:hypothetical protein BX666DRAFT_1866493 [Dichotomocladium elegans]|nr:hypothetical protein BX666DRAFT_1866493 [Dichotomocladium elegans]